MPFLDRLKKKDKHAEEHAPAPEPPQDDAAEDFPVFTFMRTDTHTQEIISPPSFSPVDSYGNGPFSKDKDESSQSRLSARHSRSPSASSHSSDKSRPRRLSQRLHLRKSDPTSPSVPDDLPDIAPIAADEDGGAGKESLWEKRATILALKNGQEMNRPTTPVDTVADIEAFANMSRSPSRRASPSPGGADVNIQEAIRLHEAGDLENSTRMFGRLADPKGENDPLSQVLYGLALRYVHWPF